MHLWTGNRPDATNTETVGCLENNMEALNLPTILLGDFNVHIEKLDDETYMTGRDMLSLIEKMRLVMVNGTVMSREDRDKLS